MFFPDSELPPQVRISGCTLTRSLTGGWFLGLRRGDVIVGADKVLAALFKRLQIDSARRQASVQARATSAYGLDCEVPPLDYTVDREGIRIADAKQLPHLRGTCP